MRKNNIGSGNTIDLKVLNLEDGIKTTNQRLDGFGNELKILLAEINVISEWISERFGVNLIDKSSFLFKHIHNYEEIEEIASNISSLYSCNQSKEKDRNGLKSRREIIENSDSNISNENSYEGGEIRKNRNPEVLTIECGHGGKRLKQKRGRPRKSRGIRDKLETDRTEDNFEEQPEKNYEVPKRGRGRPRKKIIQEVEISTEKEVDPMPTQCDQCGKILKDSSSLRQHKLIHKNLRPHPCLVCGKCFRRKFHLKTHLLIHSGEKKHQCGFCGKLFLLPKDLVAHERIHTGEKPYSCTTCPKSFNLKSHLTMHLRIHTGEKPYKCDVCKKCFSQSNSLRVHKKIHLKEKKENEFTNLEFQKDSQEQQIKEDYSSPENVQTELPTDLVNNEDVEFELPLNSLKSQSICVSDVNHLERNSQVSLGPMINTMVVEKCEAFGNNDQPISIVINQPLGIVLNSDDQEHQIHQSTVDLPGLNQAAGMQGSMGMIDSTPMFLTNRQTFIGQDASFAIEPFHDSTKLRYY